MPDVYCGCNNKKNYGLVQTTLLFCFFTFDIFCFRRFKPGPELKVFLFSASSIFYNPDQMLPVKVLSQHRVFFYKTTSRICLVLKALELIWFEGFQNKEKEQGFF